MADRTAAPRLLIVEDDRALGAMLAELFTDEGYEVTWHATVSRDFTSA